jgi:predicted glycosyltransferase
MKIAVYCQHVLGIGHLIRTLEICRALANHNVILITGGEMPDVSFPSHTREFQLPALMMDADFKALFATDTEKTFEQIKEERCESLHDFFVREAPELFLVELYPFGRKAFRFELDPILEGIRSGHLPACEVVCSLRDILVEKKDAASYENRVIDLLNNYYDALLIHSDPDLLRLDTTFSRISDITIPIVYTGFVSAKPEPDAGRLLRRKLAVKRGTSLLVASAGGGKVGGRLLKAVVEAQTHVKSRCLLHMFSGPFMADTEFSGLQKYASDTVRVSRFTSDFLAFLDAASLSISMAGYNTCMNVLATGVPAIVWPFPQNREQRLRAEKLVPRGGIHVLSDNDLDPSRLAGLIDKMLTSKMRMGMQVDLDGAAKTAAWLER